MLADILIKSVLASFAGAVLSLDRTAALQIMVSRPLVAGPVIGYLMGNPGAGLLVGATLELLFIGDLPVGAYIPVHETGLTVLVTALTVTALKAAGPAASGALRAMIFIPVTLVVSIPVSKIYQKADTLTRRFNSRFYYEAALSLASGEPVSLVKANLKGLAPFFLMNLISLLITVVPMTLAAGLIFSYITLPWFLYPAFAGCVIVGMASAFNVVYADRSLLIFSASGVAAAVAWAVAG